MSKEELLLELFLDGDISEDVFKELLIKIKGE